MKGSGGGLEYEGGGTDGNSKRWFELPPSPPPALKRTRALTDTSRQASIEKRSSRGDKRPVSARQIKKKDNNNKTLFWAEGGVCGRRVGGLVVRLLISAFIRATSAGCH